MRPGSCWGEGIKTLFRENTTFPTPRVGQLPPIQYQGHPGTGIHCNEAALPTEVLFRTEIQIETDPLADFFILYDEQEGQETRGTQ